MDIKDEWVAKFARIEALLTRQTHQTVYSPMCMHMPHPDPTGTLSRSHFVQPSVSDPSLPAGLARVQDRSPDKKLTSLQTGILLYSLC